MPPIPAFVGHAFNAVASVLFASHCAACNDILETPLSGPVCKNCWASIRPITPPICDRCGDPLASWRAGTAEKGHCLRCRHMTRPIDRGRAIGEYDGALREIIHALKYERRRSLAAGLAGLMRARGLDVLREADFAVPVPLHRRRERQRGFNQARELARHLGLPVLDCLRRRRDTQPQTTLAAGRRHANVRGAFVIKTGLTSLRQGCGGPPKLQRSRGPWATAGWKLCATRAGRATPEGARVVLVDDVSTTGATLDACAVVLKEAGAREVYALTAARVVSKLL